MDDVDVVDLERHIRTALHGEELVVTKVSEKSLRMVFPSAA